MAFARGDWRPSTVTRTVMTCDAVAFRVHAQLDAYEGLAFRVGQKNLWDGVEIAALCSTRA